MIRSLTLQDGVVHNLYRLSNGQKKPRGSNSSEKQSFSSVSVQASLSEYTYQSNRTENTQIHAAPYYGYGSNQQYATHVIAGFKSLGIDISPELRLTLTDQHGT
jgi:hypothetical protein